MYNKNRCEMSYVIYLYEIDICAAYFILKKSQLHHQYYISHLGNARIVYSYVHREVCQHNPKIREKTFLHNGEINEK